MTDLAGRLSQINEHGSVVGIISLRVVQDVVTVHAIAIFVYQYISADTCMTSLLHAPLGNVYDVDYRMDGTGANHNRVY